MTVLVIFLLLIICGLLGYLLRESAENQPITPPDPEAAAKAALELHRIRRRLETADLKQRQRRDAVRFKRELAKALEEDRP